MAHLTFETLAVLAAVAFVAGFVDAIAGGGGLITVPALVLAGLDPVAAIATNKLQSSCGSGAATLAFARAGHINLREAVPLAAAAGAGSIMGATLLARLPHDALATVLPVVLIGVSAYFALSPRLADVDSRARMKPSLFAVLVVPVVGCYDGLFGPGAGSFYMLGFVALLGYGAIRATARTKVSNFASNIAGLATLSLSGQIVWPLGLAMGLGQLAGAWLGAHATLRVGARLVRPLVIAVSLVLALRVAADRSVFLREHLPDFLFPSSGHSGTVDEAHGSR